MTLGSNGQRRWLGGQLPLCEQPEHSERLVLPGVALFRMVALLGWFIPEVQACHNILAIFIFVRIQNLSVSAVATLQAVE